MSLTDSGNAFYSETNPEAIGSPVLKDTQGALDNVEVLPADAPAPPYNPYADSGADSFAPSSVSDPTFQPDLANPQPVPQFNQLALIAAGVFVLWLIFKGDR